MAKAVLYSDEDELDEEELRAFASFPGMSPVQGGKGRGEKMVLGKGGGGGRGDVRLHDLNMSCPYVRFGVGRWGVLRREGHFFVVAIFA